MDKQILFLVIGAIIWVIQMVIKSRSKANKQVNPIRVNSKLSVKEDRSRFYNVLDDFSNKLKRELEVSVEPQETQSNNALKANKDRVLVNTSSKSKVFLAKRKGRIAPLLKSQKTLKEAVIVSEILKTKF